MRNWRHNPMTLFKIALMAALSVASPPASAQDGPTTTITNTIITMGPRPYFLIDKMGDGPLKTRLAACANGPFRRTNFSIGHRGAGMAPCLR
ncbi:MAG: hypothetical protein Q9M48_06915 [Rhodobacterales bacterium]|nr:hypothetical protein [Rhodobacterales bacterium]